MWKDSHKSIKNMIWDPLHDLGPHNRDQLIFGRFILLLKIVTYFNVKTFLILLFLQWFVILQASFTSISKDFWNFVLYFKNDSIFTTRFIFIKRPIYSSFRDLNLHSLFEMITIHIRKHFVSVNDFSMNSQHFQKHHTIHLYETQREVQIIFLSIVCTN